jgi:hypothetical protein
MNLLRTETNIYNLDNVIYIEEKGENYIRIHFMNKEYHEIEFPSKEKREDFYQWIMETYGVPRYTDEGGKIRMTANAHEFYKL